MIIQPRQTVADLLVEERVRVIALDNEATHQCTRANACAYVRFFCKQRGLCSGGYWERQVRQLPRPPPLFKNTAYSFNLLYIFLKITMKLLRKVGNLRTNLSEDFSVLESTMKLGRKLGNTRLIRSEDLFFRDHDGFGRKIGKYEIEDLSFLENTNVWES